MTSDTHVRRGMSPEALCNAFDISARALRRVVFQAIDGQDVRADLVAARRELEGLLDYAALVVDRFCQMPSLEVKAPSSLHDVYDNLSLTIYEGVDAEPKKV